MNQQFDVLVVGGGIIGLTAALAMQQRGFTVAVIDAAEMKADISTISPRVYAINQASEELLKSLGVWELLEPTRLSPYQQIYVWDAQSKAHIEFDARMVANPHLGTIIEESILKQALLQRLSAKEGVTLVANHAVNAIDQTENRIQVAGEAQCWQGQLLMIADGANSPCRQLLQIPLTTWSYSQQAIVALVHTEKNHQQTAYQVFNTDGPLAFLPLAHEKLCSIVWSTTPTRAKHLMTCSEEEFNKELTHAFARKLGEVTLQGKRSQFPLTMRHTTQYSGSRWMLLGDAAHTIHPLAGLGLNLGLADLASWLSCFNANNLAAKKALSAYQRQRKHAVWQMIAMMDGLKFVFGNSLLPLIALRGLGLTLCNGLLPVKRKFIEQAAGKIFHDLGT